MMIYTILLINIHTKKRMVMIIIQQNKEVVVAKIKIELS